MKPFVSRIKDLSKKAAEIKAAIQQVPPKVAELREAMAATTGQLQQLKTDIHYSVADLKADDEDRLTQALQDIKNADDVFARAGFVLTGADLEISPVQRLLVHLTKVEDVRPPEVHALMTANQQRRTIHAILSAILQAHQMAQTVEFPELVYADLTVGIGPIPTVRLRWRLPEEVETPTSAVAATAPPPPPPPSAAPTPQPPSQSLSPFGPNPFFERPRPVSPASPLQPKVAETLPTATVAPSASEPTPPSEAPKPAPPVDPLARFKKMPVLSR